MIIAAKEGYIEGVKELLKYENINVNLPEYFENTPLNLAAQNNHLETVKELLDNQNSKNKIKINQKNIDGGVPLFYAINNNNNNNNIKIIKLLLNNSNIKIDIKDDNNTSLLYLAIQNNCLEIVKLLIEKGKELYKDKEFKEFINAKINLGIGPLHVATQNGYLDIVKLLLNNGADVNAKINLGIDPLDFAKKKKKNKKTEVINLLEKFVELNKKIKLCNNLLQNPQNLTEEQKIKIEKNLQESQKELETLLQPANNEIRQNQSSKSNSNSNTNNSGYQSQDSTNETQNQNTKTTNQNNLYDVPSDNSCLFWAVLTSYLLPARNNNEEFRSRFIQLFGKENIKNLRSIQKLLQQLDLTNHISRQDWYQNQIANNLVTDVFRNRVVDYIQSNLDTVITTTGELTFRDLIQENNDIDNNYLERMREPSTWGGTPEIIAITNILNANISVNNDAPYQPINQNSTNTINIFHVNNGIHYNFALTPEDQPNHPSVINDNQKNTPVVDTTNRPNNLQPINTKSETKVILSNNDDDQGNNIINSQEKMKIQLQKNEYHFLDKKTEDNSLKNDENLEINLIKNNNKINTNAPVVNKPIKINIANSQEITIKKVINKYNALSKEEKQQKLNEINQHYKSLPENEQKAFKDKLRDVGLGLTSTGISGAGILGISKMTGISPIKGLSTTANYIRNSLSSTSTYVSTGTEEAMEMTSLLSESTVAEGLTAAETLSVAEGTAVIGAEAGAAVTLAPETLGLSLVIGGLAIAGTAIIWWLSSHDNNSQAVKHESHNQYNEIEKYYKFLAHDQLKLDININEWDKIKQIYKNSNNYQEFKNKIKSEITNFYKEDHNGWGGSITDEDINTLINIIYNHFQEINNHFSSNLNHGWKIVTNTIGSYFIIEEE